MALVEPSRNANEPSGQPRRMSGDEFRLSRTEFDTVWQHLEMAPVPRIFARSSAIPDHDDHSHHAWETIAAKGLGTPLRINPRLLDMLRVLARPQREVDARLWFGGNVRVLAAGLEQGAVLSVLNDGHISFRSADPFSLCREAVDAIGEVLGEQRPGSGQAVSVRSSILHAAATTAAGDTERLRHELVARDVASRDATALARMLAPIFSRNSAEIRDATARGQFGAARRDHRGRRIRMASGVGFFDTDNGRYVQLRRITHGGIRWSTVAPVTSEELVEHIAALLDRCAR